MLYYNSSDIARNVPGLQDSMREYCKLADGCRWVFLCQYFSCDVDLSETAHDCCDNCQSRCACTDCELKKVFEEEKSSHLPVDPQISSILEYMLCQYFEAENQCIGIPQPCISTGLTEKLAKQVSKEYTHLPDISSVLGRFSFLQRIYAENIVAIIASVTKTNV